MTETVSDLSDFDLSQDLSMDLSGLSPDISATLSPDRSGNLDLETHSISSLSDLEETALSLDAALGLDKKDKRKNNALSERYRDLPLSLQNSASTLFSNKEAEKAAAEVKQQQQPSKIENKEKKSKEKNKSNSINQDRNENVEENLKQAKERKSHKRSHSKKTKTSVFNVLPPEEKSEYQQLWHTVAQELSATAPMVYLQPSHRSTTKQVQAEHKLTHKSVVHASDKQGGVLWQGNRDTSVPFRNMLRAAMQPLGASDATVPLSSTMALWNGRRTRPLLTLYNHAPPDANIKKLSDPLAQAKALHAVPWTAHAFAHVASPDTSAAATASATSDTPLPPWTMPQYHLAMIDQRGHLYLCYLDRNQYHRVARTGVSGTAVAFHPYRRKELWLGGSDSTCQIHHTDNQQLLATLKGHTQPIHAFSFHSTKPHALTVSRAEAIVWQCEQLTKRRVLTGAASVGLHFAMFSPTGEVIVTLFHDASTVIWDSETFACRWRVQLNAPPHAALSTSDAPAIVVDGNTTSALASLDHVMSQQCALSRDGSVMAAAVGRQSSIYLWDVSNYRFIQEVFIPAFEAKKLDNQNVENHNNDNELGGIRQMAFIKHTKWLLVLSRRGQLVVIDTATAKLLFKMPSSYLIHSFSVTNDGHLLAVVPRVHKAQMTLLPLDHLLSDLSAVQRPSFVQVKSVSATNAQNLDYITNPQFTQTTPSNAMEPPLVIREEPNENTNPSVNRGISFKQAAQIKDEDLPRLLDIVDLEDHHAMLNRKKLMGFVNHFGEYPSQYRNLIWRFLLQLPENRTAFHALLEKGLHPSVVQFKRQYPLKSHVVSCAMERVLSALSFWSPVFGECTFLPRLVFPFAQMFGSDTFTCFEIVATFFVNWGQMWFEFFPHAPIDVMDAIEDLLAFHDNALLSHFKRRHLTSQVYAWPLLQGLFSDVFTVPEWRRVMDHVFTFSPGFLLHVLVSYLRHHRTALMHAQQADEIKSFLARPAATNVTLVLREAHRMLRSTPAHLQPPPAPPSDVAQGATRSSLVYRFTPLLKGAYPIFERFPKTVVNYQRLMRDKIREEEEEILRQRKVQDEVAQIADDVIRDQKMQKSALETSDDLVKRWWTQLEGETQQHFESAAKQNNSAKEERGQLLQRMVQARQALVDAHSSQRGRQSEWLNKTLVQQQHLLEQKTAQMRSDDSEMQVEQRAWDKETDALTKSLTMGREPVYPLPRSKMNIV